MTLCIQEPKLSDDFSHRSEPPQEAPGPPRKPSKSPAKGGPEAPRVPRNEALCGLQLGAGSKWGRSWTPVCAIETPIRGSPMLPRIQAIANKARIPTSDFRILESGRSGVAMCPVASGPCSPLRRSPDVATWPMARYVSQRADLDARLWHEASLY